MTLQGYNPKRTETIHPAAQVTHNRFVGFAREQCTVAGEPVYGGAPETILLATDGAVVVEGSVLITTGAAIPLIAGGGTFAWVQTDANGAVIPYAGGAANVAGIVRSAKLAANELACVEILPMAAPLV
jgi:hypothetical protein